jgi:hypothetical protein
MIIYAIKIDDKKIATILNFIKYICSPNSKTEIHLSVRGPYKVKLSATKIEELNNIVKGALIRVNELSNFFLYNQNTVYLRCISNIVKKVWNKTGYGYNPHLTLYDGKDAQFAFELYETLKDIEIDIQFSASNLILYDTEKLDASTLLAIGIDNEIIYKIIGVDFQTIDPVSMANLEKLTLIKKCFLALKTVQ